MHTLTVAAIGLLILATLRYLARARRDPMKTCRKCAGHGSIINRPGRGRIKACPRCQGYGIRPRAYQKTANRTRRTVRNARNSRR